MGFATHFGFYLELRAQYLKHHFLKGSYQHFQARRLLLILEFGSFAVFADVSFFFMPVILAQKESLRLPPSGCGAFSPGLPGLALL